MQMVGEVVHVIFEAFARIEKLVLAAGHGCDRLGRVFPHGLPEQNQWGKEIRPGIHIVLIATAFGVEHVGERRRKCQRIHSRIPVSDGPHDIIKFANSAPMVAGLAD